MALKNRIRKLSPWVYVLHTGGCNGCDIEIPCIFTPRYDVERFGIKLVATPRFADVLLVTGPVCSHALPFAKRIYSQVPDPKVVVSVGSCASTGGVYKLDADADNYAVAGPSDQVFPVDVFVPGCPPKPEAIIQGILLAVSKL